MIEPAPSFYAYRTPLGPVTIRADARGVTDVVFGNVALDGARRPNATTNRAANELLEYLAGKRAAFDVPLALAGSAFQQEVWRAVGRIPYGQVRTSAEVAGSLGRPSSYRAVGGALRRNPAAVLVPAHRIVGTDGRPLGTGPGAERAARLLEMERGGSPAR